MELNFSTPDYMVMLVYFGISVVIGIYCMYRIKSGKDFLLGGKSFGVFSTLCTQAATMKGSGAILGYSAGAYLGGVSVFFASSCYHMGGWIAIIIGMARKLKKCSNIIDIRTPGDIFYARFGTKRLKGLSGLACLWLEVAFLGGQMAALGLLIHLLFRKYGLSYEMSLIAGCLLVIVYTTLGGFVSVVYNDVYHWLIMTPMVMAVMPYLLFSSGVTPSKLHAALDAGTYFSLQPNIWWLSYLIGGLLCAMVDVAYLTRFITAKDEASAVKGSLYGMGYCCLFAGFIIVFGLSAAMLVPAAEIPNKDAALFMLSQKVLPAGLLGLFIAAILATVMSSVDSYLHASTNITLTDLLYVYRKEPLPAKQELLYCRFVTLIIGALAIFIVLKLKVIVVILNLAHTGYAGMMFCPMMMTMYWKKTTEKGCCAGIIIGGIASIIFLYTGVVMPMVWGVLTSGAATYLVSMLEYQKEGGKELLPGFNEQRMKVDQGVSVAAIIGLLSTLAIGLGIALWINFALICVGIAGFGLCYVLVNREFANYRPS